MDYFIQLSYLIQSSHFSFFSQRSLLTLLIVFPRLLSTVLMYRFAHLNFRKKKKLNALSSLSNDKFTCIDASFSTYTVVMLLRVCPPFLQHTKENYSQVRQYLFLNFLLLMLLQLFPLLLPLTTSAQLKETLTFYNGMDGSGEYYAK